MVLKVMTGFGVLALLAGCGSADQAKTDAANIADAAANGAAKAAHGLANAADTVAERADNSMDEASEAASAANNGAVPAASALVTNRWVGRWKGVEGTMLTIAKAPGKGAGHYRLTMQYTLDDKGVFDGVASGDTIRFARPDGDQALYASDGKTTGLKWLAHKKDCLTVKPGEGYCRD